MTLSENDKHIGKLNRSPFRFRVRFVVTGVRIPSPTKFVSNRIIRFSETRPGQHATIGGDDELEARVLVWASDNEEASRLAKEELQTFLYGYSIEAGRDARIVKEVANEQLTGHPRRIIHLSTIRVTGAIRANSSILARWSDELKRASRILRLYKQVKRRDYIDVARQHYAYALSSSRLETKFVECIAGLEALYSDSAPGNSIAYKLSVRISTILGNKPEEGLNIYRFMKKMYKLRSDLLHGRGWNGSDRSFVEKNISYLMENLRISLIRFLRLGRRFTKDVIIRELDESIAKKTTFRLERT